MNNKIKPRLKNSRYITGIDGLRALAVIGVIIYHLLPYKLKGGYMGVPIFFVISGYLITDLLIKELHQNGWINLKAFYCRRIKRLYPALVTTVIGSGAYITLFQRNLLVHLRSVIWTNLLYVYNWWEILHGQSYFDRFAGESPFIHLWTLSIDGQYYLFWPIVMIAFAILMHHKRKLLAVTFLALTLIGAWYMSLVYDTTRNINRVYYGTDTRMFSIFAGIALAYSWPADGLKRHLNQFSRWVLNLLGLITFLILVYAFVTMSGQSASTYKSGMLIVSLAATILLATIVHPGADVNRAFTNPIFHWIGTRSYGIYLYQFPVMIFYEAKVPNQAAHPVVNALIEILIIAVISELSYRWIERPLRHYNYRNLGQFIKRLYQDHFWRGLLVVPIVVVCGICAVGAVQAPKHQAPNALQKRISQNQRSMSRNNHQLLKRQADHKVNVLHGKRARKAMKKPLNSKEKHLADQYGLTKLQLRSAKQFPMTAVGDSVMVDCSPDLKSVFSDTYVSAKVGGQLDQAADALRHVKSNHELSPNVLINIGTNAPLTKGQIKEILEIAGSHRNVYWITCHVPTRNYQNSVNANIKSMAKHHRNLHVIDWYKASRHHPNYFWSDHVHPNPTGNKAFVKLIARVILK